MNNINDVDRETALAFRVRNGFENDPARWSDPNGMTALLCGKELVKTYIASEFDPGQYKKIAEPDATDFEYYPVTIPDCVSMARTLAMLSNPNARKFCLIRGALHILCDLLTTHRRIDHGKPLGVITDAPRLWMCGDIDGVPMPDGLSYDDPEGVIAYLMRECLPDHWRDVWCAYQISNSAALTAHRTIKAHLYFRLSEATSCADLYEILKAYPVFDKRMGLRGQINFTGSPIIRGVNGMRLVDPLEGRRVGLYVGSRHEVDLTDEVESVQAARAVFVQRPAPEYEARLDGDPDDFAGHIPSIVTPYRDRNWPKFLITMGDGGDLKGYRSPIFSMICSALTCGENDYARLKAALREDVWAHVKVNGASRGRGADLDRYLSDASLNEWIANAARPQKVAV